MERSGFDGMVTTNQSLLALVEAGRIDGESGCRQPQTQRAGSGPAGPKLISHR